MQLHLGDPVGGTCICWEDSGVEDVVGGGVAHRGNQELEQHQSIVTCNGGADGAYQVKDHPQYKHMCIDRGRGPVDIR